MSLEHVVEGIRANAALILGLIAAVLLLLNILLSRRVMRLRAALRQSKRAAEEAARAAAMAAPGGIDPEAVIEVLRRGVPPTLDNVYAAMQRREAKQQPAPPRPQVSSTASAPAPPR